MSGKGTRAVRVPCATCNGTGKTAGVTRQLEFQETTCVTCHGQCTIVVTRLSNGFNEAACNA